MQHNGFGAGAGNVTRTHDLLITNQLLYRLSYTSKALIFYHENPAESTGKLLPKNEGKLLLRTKVFLNSLKLLRGIDSNNLRTKIHTAQTNLSAALTYKFGNIC